VGVSSLQQPDEPTVVVRPPEEALRRARRLPPREDLVIPDVPDEEWSRFMEALAEA
jgi:hypothetical protein